MTGGTRTADTGCGGVGLNVLQGAALGGATTIIAVDTQPSKEALAREFGATHFVLSSDHTLQDIRDLTGGRGADRSFEAVGIPKLQELAFEAARPGGSVVLAACSAMKTGKFRTFP